MKLQSKLIRLFGVLSLFAILMVSVFGNSVAGGTNLSTAQADAYDAFVKIDGIEGESKDSAHPGEIAVLSYDQGVTNQVNTSGGGGGASKPSFSDIRFRKLVDSTSPVLMLNTATGKHLPSATFSFRKSGASADFYKVTLKDITITATRQVIGVTQQGPLSFNQLEASTGGVGLIEEVTISYSTIEWEVFPTHGRLPSIHSGYDLKTATPIN